jgi:DNA-binding CsgD family transcriptional regulator
MILDIDKSAAARKLDFTDLPPAVAKIVPFAPPHGGWADTRLDRQPDRARATRLWAALLDGHLEIAGTYGTDTRVRTTVRPTQRSGPRQLPTQREKLILRRVLAGDLQKTVAIDLSLAPSTVATDLARVLAKLGLQRPIETVPLPIVALAQEAIGVTSGSNVEIEESEQGEAWISVARPDYQNRPELTPAERDVARLVAEGLTRGEIARIRLTSVHTVANQVSAVFTRLRVSGRYALILAAHVSSGHGR